MQIGGKSLDESWNCENSKEGKSLKLREKKGNVDRGYDGVGVIKETACVAS